MESFDAQRADFAPYGFTCELWAPQQMPRADRHEEIEINFVAEGVLTYVIGGRRVRVEPQQLTVFWAAAPHQIVSFSGVSSYFVVTIPFDRFLKWGPPEAMRSRLVAGDVLVCDDTDQSKLDALMMRRWQEDLTKANEAIHDIVALEMRARVLRLANSALTNANIEESDESASSSPIAPGLEKAERMASFIARNYNRPLRIPDIARSVDLHPDYAATVFRKSFGVTLNTQIARHRVAEVQRKLITTQDPITDIAFGAGFESLSSFNRTFRKVTGVTPRAYRKQLKE